MHPPTSTAPAPSPSPSIPPRAGVGLRHRHVADFLTAPPDVAWIEVHSETYLAAGGPRLRALEAIRRDFPLSCHGVGLSLGSADGVDPRHLERLAVLYARLQPELVSDHLAWSSAGGAYLNDLLPLPYTEEALETVRRNVEQVQEALKRPILVENPSRYLSFAQSTIPEPEFLAELARRTGCGLLLDVNNIHVSAHNVGLDPLHCLSALPAGAVGEIHVAGHAVHDTGRGTLLIDDHGSTVADPVWDLLAEALRRTGPRPVLVEWDTRVPELPVLLAEAVRADRLLARTASEARHAA
ncbi:MNIO family bufferin maturase [Azospirillum sp. sgz302134]